MFDRDRNFRGYRGFGVCRDVARINATDARRSRAVAPAAPRVEPPVFRDERRPTAAAAAGKRRAVSRPRRPTSVPTLTPVERSAFSELASRLTARLRGAKDKPDQTDDIAPATAGRSDVHRVAAPAAQPEIRRRNAMPSRRSRAGAAASQDARADQRPILDRLPIGVLVYRLDKLIYANRAFLDWTGYDQSARAGRGRRPRRAVRRARRPTANRRRATARKTLTIATSQRRSDAGRSAGCSPSPWDGESALVLMLTGVGSGVRRRRPSEDFETALRRAKAEASELRDILDTATDGVMVLDRDGRVLSINRSAADAVRLRRAAS